MNKKVKYILPAEYINMGGIMIKQALPTQKVEQIDPFLLLHHGKLRFNDKSPAKHQGVGPHPHRGFSPVTFVIDGEIHHRDSRGNDQVAKSGEVQWMHAGAGIIHSERPTQALVDAKRHQEIIQLWINTPADKKMLQPDYQFVDGANMVTIESPDGRRTTKVIAGEYEGKTGTIKPQSEVMILWSSSMAEDKDSIAIPAGHNSAIYLIEGRVRLEGYGVLDNENLVVFDNEGDKIQLETLEDAQYLVLSGRPLAEEVVQYGPFVMNDQTQIMEAMRDYQMGKMGVLIEEG